jgi:hypothetical protein
MPAKRQIASSARLTALNSMCASAWINAALPSAVRIERRLTASGDTSSGKAGRPGSAAAACSVDSGARRRLPARQLRDSSITPAIFRAASVSASQCNAPLRSSGPAFDDSVMTDGFMRGAVKWR